MKWFAPPPLSLPDMTDHSQFLPLFLACQTDLRAFIGAVVRDAQAREDIFQATALTLWETFDRYDPAKPFGAWARGVAAKKVLHAHRKDARFPLVFAPEVVQAVADACDRTETPAAPREAALRECLRHLPEKTRRVLALRYEQDLSGEGIALRTRMTVAAVHQTLSRGRAALGECVRRRLERES